MMNNILLLVPTSYEAFFLKNTIKNLNANSPFTIESFLCGIGPVQTALNLSLHIMGANSRNKRRKDEDNIFQDTRVYKKYDLLILTGICGVYQQYSDMFKVGDVVMARDEIYGDLGRCNTTDISGLNIENTEKGIVKIETEAVDRKRLTPLALPSDFNQKLKTIQIKSISFTTVMCVSASFRRAEAVQRFSGAHCENMEGAAFFETATAFNIPFIEIRAISNVAGDKKENWKISEAMDRLKRVLIMLLSF